ncbi:MAG: calcium-translocating P-type ATPase, PMCA-type [Patescibacteria group bacterium]
MEARGSYFNQSVSEVLATFSSNQSKGLSEQEAKSRLAKYGENQLTPPKPPSPWLTYLAQYKNALIIILLIAALLTIGIWLYTGEQADLIEALLIIAIVVMITAFGFFQEYKAEKALAKIKSLLSFEARVVRGGVRRNIPTTDLVPGDVVILEEGDKVPADLRLLDVADLRISEAILTGEANPVEKIPAKLTGKKLLSEQANLAFSGTVVARGRGLGVVVNTGNNTEIGHIAKMVSVAKETMTPIQQRLNVIGRIIGIAVAVIAAVLFIYTFLFGHSENLSLLERFLTAAIAAVALAVAAVPEGLPAVVTIAMAFGTQKMLKRNVLVRKLNSVETLGSVDVICADKTGTLTTGEMTVSNLWTISENYLVSGAGYATVGEITSEGGKPTKDDPALANLLTAGLACNNATITPKPTGDPTEIALLVSAAKAKINLNFRRLKEIPFNSERKMMSVIGKQGSEQIVYAKGAPEVVLKLCTEIFDGQKVRRLTANDKRQILAANEEMANRALRVLAFAYKPAQGGVDYSENGLIFSGLQGMNDPARPEISETLALCRESGIRVIMITGDNPQTAKAIAREIGLGERCLTGQQLDKMGDDEFERLAEVTSIYARVSPGVKLRIIGALKKTGHIVAMTGDGVNDAPALKKADIGVAMGISGTDVAKEASDMVLLDDNFATIVAAIGEGRGIYHNIRKFVNYLISCNLAEVVVVFVGALIFQDLLLTAVMLLWINVVTDGLPAVAIGLDPAEQGIMKRHPQDFQQEIITKAEWYQMISYSLFISLSCLVVYWLNVHKGLGEARTATFTALVIFELARIFVIRLRYRLPVFSNPFLLGSVVLSVALQLAILYLEPLREVFGLTHLSSEDWWPILLVAAVVLILPAILTLLNRQKQTV